jgi:ribosomal protein S18 acetylase RimI-like enzyme
MSEVIIRDMEAGDLDQVSVLAAQLVRQHHAFDARRFLLIEPVEQGYRWFLDSQLSEDGVLLLVAELDGVIAGYVYGALEERNWALLLDAHGAIHDVFVDQRFRRRGVAKRLMEVAISRLEAQAEQVVLSSASPNVEAQALFRSLGFRNTMVEMTRSRT